MTKTLFFNSYDIKSMEELSDKMSAFVLLVPILV